MKHLKCGHDELSSKDITDICAVCICKVERHARDGYKARDRIHRKGQNPQVHYYGISATQLALDDCKILDKLKNKERKVGMSPELAMPYGGTKAKALGLPDEYYARVREELYSTDNHFADALAYRLAHDLAENIVEQGRDADHKLELWKYLLMLAGSIALIYLITYFASYIELGGIK